MESIGSSIALGAFLVAVTVSLAWPGLDALAPLWKLASAAALVIGLYLVASGLYRLARRVPPMVRCIDCSYQWPWG